MEFFLLLLWFFTWSLFAYALPAAVARYLDFRLMQKYSARVPKASVFALYHGMSTLVLALFNPILCFIVVGQIYVALGHASLQGFQGSFDELFAMWLFSLALPLQLHYTVNAPRVRNLETNEIQPRWLSLGWALGTFVSVTLAWVILWSIKPTRNIWPWDLLQ